jgi:putative FmdB family regulatory protein
MPTYEFRCPDGHLFDKFYRSISAAEMEVPCATCGKVAARQISGGAGLQFKGAGFYLTDYGKNAHRGNAKPAANASGGESKGGGEAPASGSSGGDGKPATPPSGAGGESGRTPSGGSSSGGSSSGGSSSGGSSSGSPSSGGDA